MPDTPAPAAGAEDVVLTGKILRWGNSYGLRISKADARRVGLAPGAEVTFRLSLAPGLLDLADMPAFRGGRPDDAERHDELLAEALEARLGLARRRARRGSRG